MRILLIVMAILISGCCETKEQKKEAGKCGKVEHVGGCDKYGECGVTLDDGRHATSYFPSKGMEVCI